jgi:hypothetical protein
VLGPVQAAGEEFVYTTAGIYNGKIFTFQSIVFFHRNIPTAITDLQAS